MDISDNSRSRIKFLLMSLVFILFSSAYGLDVFVWQHSNGLVSPDPVFEEEITSCEAITRTLDVLEINYVCDDTLPNNISEYEVVVVSLGFFSST